MAAPDSGPPPPRPLESTSVEPHPQAPHVFHVAIDPGVNDAAVWGEMLPRAVAHVANRIRLLRGQEPLTSTGAAAVPPAMVQARACTDSTEERVPSAQESTASSTASRPAKAGRRADSEAQDTGGAADSRPAAAQRLARDLPESQSGAAAAASEAPHETPSTAAGAPPDAAKQTLATGGPERPEEDPCQAQPKKAKQGSGL